MANLVELSQMAEDMPDEQLIQATQGQGNFPPFVAIQEVKRRTDLRKAYEAQQPKPQTSVAEELVTEFAGSPSGLGAMAQSSDLQQAFPSGDMSNIAPLSPMQMMASGGKTGYQAGGGIGIGTDSLSATFTNPMQNQDVNNEPGVLSKAINWAKENPADALSLAANAAFFIPGAGVVLGSAVKGGIALLPKIVEVARKVAPAVKSGVQKTYTVPNPVLQGGLKVGQRKVIDPKTKTSKIIDTATGKDIPERAFSFGRASVAALPIVGSTKLGIGALLDEEEINPATVQTQTDDSKDKVVNDLVTGNVNTDKGLGQKLKDFAKSSRGADMLIGLGGAIGSARNLGELSKGISDAYFGIKSAEQATEFKGLQGKLIEAQIANMTPQAIINEQNSIIAFLKQANEGAIQLTDEQKQELNDRYFILQDQLELIRSKTGTGFAASEAPTGGDILSKNKVA